MEEGVRKILIVDDDASLHELCRAILTRYGYICLSAFNGEEGLQKIVEENPDLILLDLMMPGMNGYEVFQQFITNPKFEPFRRIPVIMLSAVVKDNQQKNVLLSQGVAAYLHKPFGLNELVNVIQNVIISNEVKLRNLQLQEEIARSKQYLERIIDHAPLGILAVDHLGKVLRANSFFAKMIGVNHVKELIGRNVFEDEFWSRPEIREHFLSTVKNGESRSIPPIDIRNLKGEVRRVNIQCVPLRDEKGEVTDVLSIWEDVTEAERRAYELTILRQIGEAFQSVLDLDILLHLILTSITAGCALGFSRAIIFLLDDLNQALVGRMGVGPASEEEANRIWRELSKDHASLPSFLSKFGLNLPAEDDPFDQKVRQLRISLADENDVLVQTVIHRKSYWIKNNEQLKAQDLTIHSGLMQNFELIEFVTVPLITKDHVLGVILADNKYSSLPLREEQISLLKLLANQAALALSNAEAYRKLEDKVQELASALEELRLTQDKLLRSEQLAIIGKMAAHVAHEIRNPLTAIGGFAKSILREPEKLEQVKLASQVIDKEVGRLEKILRNVLNFTRISKPFLKMNNLNQIIEETVMLQESTLREGITIEKDLCEDVPEFYFDDEQLKQALVNVLSNSVSSIQNKGIVRIRSFVQDKNAVIEIKDTGIGISPENLENIFNPFFTTKQDGTGLGLAVTQRILEGHEGKIEVESKVHEGSVFRLILPMVTEIPEGEQQEYH